MDQRCGARTTKNQHTSSDRRTENRPARKCNPIIRQHSCIPNFLKIFPNWFNRFDRLGRLVSRASTLQRVGPALALELSMSVPTIGYGIQVDGGSDDSKVCIQCIRFVVRDRGCASGRVHNARQSAAWSHDDDRGSAPDLCAQATRYKSQLRVRQAVGTAGALDIIEWTNAEHQSGTQQCQLAASV